MALLLLVGAIAAEPFAPFARAANGSIADLRALVDCKDQHSACADWASKGECEANAGFMLSSCRLSCGRCALHGMDAAKAQDLCRYMVRNAQGACKRAPKGATAASCGPPAQMMMVSACEATGDLLHFALSMHGVSAVVKACAASQSARTARVISARRRVAHRTCACSTAARLRPRRRGRRASRRHRAWRM